MKLGLTIISGALLAFASAGAMATPVYNGSTLGTFSDTCENSGGGNDGGSQNCPTTEAQDSNAGFYIWSNDANNGLDWSMRWTKAAGGTALNFVGTIDMILGDLSGGASGALRVRFNSGDTVDVEATGSTGMVINFDTFANTGWDGINFALNGNTTVLGFTLHSDLWDDADFTRGTSSAGMGIYIGDSFATPDTLKEYHMACDDYFNCYMDGWQQSFEIPVPEPGTIGLLGLGLAGLGLSRRRTKK